MPTITTHKNRLKNPVVNKIVLKGLNEYEISLSPPRIFTAKHAFCHVNIGKHFYENRETYGDLESIINYISSNFTHVMLDTNKGVIEGIVLNNRAINHIKKIVSANLLIDHHGLR